MKRYLALAVATLTIASATLSAQSTAGWKQRIDASTDASDPDPAGEVKFKAIPGGFQTSNPKAAVFFNPANTISGTSMYAVGMERLDELRALQALRVPLPLIDGIGRNWGLWRINSIDENQSEVIDDGTAMVIKWVIGLSEFNNA